MPEKARMRKQESGGHSEVVDMVIFTSQLIQDVNNGIRYLYCILAFEVLSLCSDERDSSSSSSASSTSTSLSSCSL